MNTSQLRKNIGQNFRIRPMPLRVDGEGRLLAPIDDEWRLDGVEDGPARILLVNVSTHHCVELESDNVQERRSPNFLLLRCQLTLRPRTVEIEPISKGSPIGIPKIIDRFVSLEYVERAGITGPLRAQGYRLRWIRADSEAEAIDLEGWTYVELVDSDGLRTRFKVKDSVCDYVVLVMKKD
jgi:hypothetical protein